jgi:hypothetical protein
MRSLRERFEAKITKLPEAPGCWLWTGARSVHGYGKLGVRGRTTLAHRLNYEWHHGSIPEGISVLHRCDVPACVRPDHLWLGLQQDNVRDSLKKGRHRPPPRHGLCGEALPQSRLTEAAVRDIVDSYGRGVLGRTLATRYGVDHATISLVIHGHTWKHIPRMSHDLRPLQYKPHSGEENVSAKLTAASVAEIRSRWRPGMGPTLAGEYGVSHQTIYAIINRETWGGA